MIKLSLWLTYSTCKKARKKRKKTTTTKNCVSTTQQWLHNAWSELPHTRGGNSWVTVKQWLAANMKQKNLRINLFQCCSGHQKHHKNHSGFHMRSCSDKAATDNGYKYATMRSVWKVMSLAMLHICNWQHWKKRKKITTTKINVSATQHPR